ncbi:ubiquitin-conjugating enzyme e2 5b-like [Anaeramoeba flamelloides]|uniref:E2 ubiquitin-conjugating enzyme n=1 Tax=Anaeramoeba flamelloides TaxID=1746091 RepID=A0AAV7YMB0_9EUKA|nr:ubiquitin-conjugating enzyme e2 5b-like [Anaeramoeba flamelloides]
MTNAQKRISRELREINEEPLVGITAAPVGSNLFKWMGTINGSEGTPYEGGVFNLQINFPRDYPYKPPQILFKTKVFHCNVDSKGHICLDILDNNWQPALTISKVLLSLSSFLSDANPDNPLNKKAGKLYLKDKQAYNREATRWTQKHAIPKKKKKK